MKNYRLKYLVFTLLFLTLGYMFSGGDCGTNNNPPAATSVAAPTAVKVVLEQASGSLATISWTHSTDQTRSDFSGYTVATYQVDSAGNVLSLFRTDDVPKASNSQVINSLIPLNRYRSYVTAKINTLKSDSVASKIYAAVFEHTGDKIDEYQASGTAKSGFGWNTDFGIGSQYSYTTENAASIDVHARNDNNTGLRFYSPDAYSPGTRSTKFELIGQGQSAYDNTDLIEPTSTSIAVVADNVYLLKLQSNNYVKIWVKTITTASGYQTINFDFKVQPIAGLRVLKH